MTTESDAAKVARLRELLPATSAGIYLDSAYRGPILAEAASAMRDADDWELRVGRATEGREEDFAQRRAEARAVIAALIGADSDDIRLTPDPIAGLMTLAATIRPLVDPNSGAFHIPDPPATGWHAVDASLAAGAIPVDVASLNADFVAIPGDKWLLGPEGIGALWIGPKARQQGVFAGRPEVALGRTPVLGLARSVGWLEMYVGLAWIHERGAALTNHLRESVRAINGADVVTPEPMATTVCFRLAAWPTDQLLAELRRRAFAIIGATPNGAAVRASVAWFNTEDEMDRFAAAVAEISRYAPDTMPRKKTLEML